MRVKIAILLSGKGSLLPPFLTLSEHQAEILVIADSPHAAGLKFAYQQGWQTEIILNDGALQLFMRLCAFDPAFIFCLGFKRKISPFIIEKFRFKIFNIHPSLLPCYPGLNTYQRMIKNNEPFYGTTLHFVNELVDQGPILVQRKEQVTKHETSETLKDKTQAMEKDLLHSFIGCLFESAPIFIFNDIEY